MHGICREMNSNQFKFTKIQFHRKYHSSWAISLPRKQIRLEPQKKKIGGEQWDLIFDILKKKKWSLEVDNIIRDSKIVSMFGHYIMVGINLCRGVQNQEIHTTKCLIEFCILDCTLNLFFWIDFEQLPTKLGLFMGLLAPSF